MPDRSAWPHSLTVHHIVHRCLSDQVATRLRYSCTTSCSSGQGHGRTVDKPSSPRPSRTTPVMRSQHTSDMVGTSAKDCASWMACAAASGQAALRRYAVASISSLESEGTLARFEREARSLSKKHTLQDHTSQGPLPNFCFLPIYLPNFSAQLTSVHL